MAEVIVSNASVNVYPVNVVVDDIKTIVDSLNAYVPDSGSMTDIEDKVDTVIVDTDILKKHIHNVERWFGAALVPNAEIHVADNILTAATYLACDAGNNDWGAWIQILGSSDTPNQVGKTKFDLHRLQVVDVERAGFHNYVQITWGATGAAGLAAGNYTEFVYKPNSAANEEAPLNLMISRVDAGTKVWVRSKCPTQDTGYFRFFIGIHEYDA